MNWLNKVSNEYPNDLIFVYIQNGKAMYRNQVSAFIETEKVIGFVTADEAEYFIENYDANCHSYTENCIKGRTIYIFNSNNRGGYYADDILT